LHPRQTSFNLLAQSRNGNIDVRTTDMLRIRPRITDQLIKRDRGIEVSNQAFEKEIFESSHGDTLFARNQHMPDRIQLQAMLCDLRPRQSRLSSAM
jgi:hypothetical protein